MIRTNNTQNAFAYMFASGIFNPLNHDQMSAYIP
jgi:hypothetical protein